MNKIPDGALLQKSKNNVSYVYFPSYYYDKDAKTHNKEKQRRLYIGKVVGGEFVPNKKYLTNPELSRKDVDSLVSAPADLSKIQTRSRSRKSVKAAYITDVDERALNEAALAHEAEAVIHGHTHRPGIATTAAGIVRAVLPDWHFEDSKSVRGGWLTFEDDKPVIHGFEI